MLLRPAPECMPLWLLVAAPCLFECWYLPRDQSVCVGEGSAVSGREVGVGCRCALVPCATKLAPLKWVLPGSYWKNIPCCSLQVSLRVCLILYRKKYLCCWKNIKSINDICAWNDEIITEAKPSCADYTVTKTKKKTSLRYWSEGNLSLWEYLYVFMWNRLPNLLSVLSYSDWFFQILLIFLWNLRWFCWFRWMTFSIVRANIKYMNGFT